MGDRQDLLELVTTRTGNKWEVAVKVGGDVLHLDTINPAVASQRKRFIKDVLEKVPAANEADIAVELLKLAAQTTARPDQAGDLQELDISRIVRPELFFTTGVSCLTVPVVTAAGGEPVAKWACYLRWADGKRERRDLAKSLELPDGSRLWVHPMPGEPSLTTAPAWSASSRRDWLAGEVSPDPATVFQRLCERFLHYLEFPPDAATGHTATLALWSLLTYCYPAWDALPYLYVGGPLNSGKSRVFDILERVAFRPFKTDNITAAGVFRTLHDQGGTLFFDEAERLRQATPDQQDLLGMLLAGYKRGGQATRLEKVGDSFQTVRFDVFGPKALACIAGLPATLSSRSIPVTMFRAGADSPKPRRKLDDDPAAWGRLRDDLHALTLEHGASWLDLARKADVVPADLAARDFQIWQPLLALAWWLEQQGAKGLHRLVREHALRLTEQGKDDQANEADEVLLQTLAERVRRGERPTCKELLQDAREADPATFDKWSPNGVRNRLKCYGIVTRKCNARREYRDVRPDHLRTIQRTYGMDLGFAAAEEQVPAHT